MRRIEQLECSRCKLKAENAFEVEKYFGTIECVKEKPLCVYCILDEHGFGNREVIFRTVTLDFYDVLYMDSDCDELIDVVRDIVHKHLPNADFDYSMESIEKDADYVGENSDVDLDENLFDSEDNPVDRSGNSRYEVYAKFRISDDGDIKEKIDAIKSEILEYSAPTGKFIE